MATTLSTRADTGTGAPLDRARRRRWPGLTALGLLLVAAAVLSLVYGVHPVPPADVWRALTAPTGGEHDIIVRSLRAPRTLAGILAGIALGIGGALMQGHTRNPIADPGLLGVNQGAAFGIVTAVVVFGITDLTGFVWFGFAGALVAATVVFGLGTLSGRGGSTPVTLALAGAAVSALLSGLTAAVVLANKQGMEVFRFWQVGSLAGRDYAVLGQMLPFLLAGLVLALLNAPGLNTLALGDDVATALGRNLARTRIVGVGAITLLVGAAVAACGPIAFVGLLVPHAARVLTGPDYRWLVPFAGLLGAILLLLADVLGRLVADDRLEVGIMLAVLGAPVFIRLVRGKGLARL
ncbi:FecCD family ABC transporter permease [Saccharomonospora saliphila]|uniref:FecCD family ABC transporter permease n=1 Tax=Saccharomonospora saliphila TaxID=369829 RepID=UPI0003762CF5|nr:iron ABC transporter permease [Saccharomonospora saliphila]